MGTIDILGDVEQAHLRCLISMGLVTLGRSLHVLVQGYQTLTSGKKGKEAGRPLGPYGFPGCRHVLGYRAFWRLQGNKQI